MPKKMKRVDDTAKETEEQPLQPNPVVSSPSGVFVMDKNDLKEMLEEEKVVPKGSPEDASKQKVNAAKKTNKIITVDAAQGNHPPMEEVSYESFLNVKDVEIAKGDVHVSTTDKIKALIGEHIETAKSVLEDLKNKKVLANYRFVPVGSVTTLDLQPGRVQLVVDMSKKIIDVTIS